MRFWRERGHKVDPASCFHQQPCSTHTACQQCSLMHMWTDARITRTTKFFIASGCFPPKWTVKLFAPHRRGKSRAAVRSRCVRRCALCSEKRGEAGGEAGSCTYRVPPKPFLFLKIVAALPTWTRGKKKNCPRHAFKWCESDGENRGTVIICPKKQVYYHKDVSITTTRMSSPKMTTYRLPLLYSTRGFA